MIGDEKDHEENRQITRSLGFTLWFAITVIWLITVWVKHGAVGGATAFTVTGGPLAAWLIYTTKRQSPASQRRRDG